MRKFTKTLITGVLAVATSFTAVNCAGRAGSTDVPEENVDTSKTQLYVWNYNGGYGTDWLYKAKERFEELQKDVVYEDGTIGCQIRITGEKPGSPERSAADVRNSKFELYFTEGQDYYKLFLGDGNGDAIGDITEAVTTPNQFEKEGNATVMSKLTAQQQEYYTIGGKVYGIPHYQGNFGFIYNIDLFNQKGLYFAEGYENVEDINKKFLGRGRDKKSAGPDGIKGTYDDGLPVTYADFLTLLKYIKSFGKSIKPITWTGKYREQYINLTFNAAAADVDGAEQHKLKYDMSGTATTLGTLDADGNFVKDAAPTVINDKNAYELARQEGTYQAIQLFGEIFGDETNYDGMFARNSSDENTAAQLRFVRGQAAILMEGVWWEGESEQANNFAAVSKKREECNFGLMPMPKPEGHVGEKNTVVDVMDALCFTKAGLSAGKKKLACDFIKFVYSDPELVAFTKNTNALKAVNYVISEEDQRDLTTFGKILYKYVHDSDVVYEYSTNPLYYNNAYSLRGRAYYQGDVAGLDTSGSLAPHQYLLDMKKTGKSDLSAYFSGIAAHWQKGWDNLNKG